MVKIIRKFLLLIAFGAGTTSMVQSTNRLEFKNSTGFGLCWWFMAEALTHKGANFTGIYSAAQAIDAASSRARQMDQALQYDFGVGENFPYLDDYFYAVVCVYVLEHVTNLTKVLAEVARVLKPGGVVLYDTINRNSIARLATITLAEDVLHFFPKGPHDPGDVY